jgi:hypothetical protein
LEGLNIQGIPEIQIEALIQALELKWQSGRKLGFVEGSRKAFQDGN